MVTAENRLTCTDTLRPRAKRDHDEREFRTMHIVLLLLILVESASAVAAMLFHQWRIEVAFLPHILIGYIVLAGILTRHLSSQRDILREVSAALVSARSYVEKLEQTSLIDPTTQLFNRRYLAELFDHQLKGLSRTGKPVALLLLEVMVSEQNTAAGQIIMEAAFILRSNFRASDCLVRYSADQFLVVLPDTNGQQAQIALSRRGPLEQCKQRQRNRSVPGTQHLYSRQENVGKAERVGRKDEGQMRPSDANAGCASAMISRRRRNARRGEAHSEFQRASKNSTDRLMWYMRFSSAVYRIERQLSSRCGDDLSICQRFAREAFLSAELPV